MDLPLTQSPQCFSLSFRFGLIRPPNHYWFGFSAMGRERERERDKDDEIKERASQTSRRGDRLVEPLSMVEVAWSLAQLFLSQCLEREKERERERELEPITNGLVFWFGVSKGFWLSIVLGWFLCLSKLKIGRFSFYFYFFFMFCLVVNKA